MNEIEKPNQNELLVFSPEECEKIKPIISDFVDSYTAHVDMPVKKWLTGKMKHELPERSEQEVETMVDDIIESLQINEEKQQSLELAVANGRQKESWFANELDTCRSACGPGCSTGHRRASDCVGSFFADSSPRR